MKIMRGSGNDRSTNMSNGHTLVVGCKNLIMPMIVIMCCQLVQFPCDMICGTEIQVPLGMRTVHHGGSGDSLLFWYIFLIEMVPANVYCVTGLKTYLVARMAGGVRQAWSRGARIVGVARRMTVTTTIEE
jgi:hypothetical protein